ncbi:unnamed protein product [Gongylonema pulchrum]|uniref:Uncharacterized protein n=1 Tax=Gongylonema pulchrum TaxID=637853 RepID=A0A183EIQ8_9BILA|nr:unnamed protein product [Gongylonema pulchrum]
MGRFDRDNIGKSERMQLLADASLAQFMELHGNLYKHCTTPDCRGLHRVRLIIFSPLFTLYKVTEEVSLGRWRTSDFAEFAQIGIVKQSLRSSADAITFSVCSVKCTSAGNASISL